jgi:predicted amidohydrolase YtcJ
MFAAALAVVLANAHVLTMNPTQPVATTLAVVDERIAYVGDDVAAARKAAGPGAEVIDLAGRTIVPGFNDAHVHFGFSLTLGSSKGIMLPDLSRKRFIEAVKQASAARPGSDWLFVQARALPPGITRARDLDFVERPLFLVTQHGGILNSRARSLGGFTAEEAPDGFIHGRVIAAALDRLVKALPLRTLTDGARGFLQELAKNGITSVQLIDELPELFEGLRQRHLLTARVRMIPLGFRFETRLYEPSWKGSAPEWVRVDGVKYYHDDGARITRFELQEIFARAVKSRRRVVVHVLTGRALDTLLDGLEAAANAIGHKEEIALFRIEHADEVSREQAARLQRLGVIVCSNPSMIPEWHWRKDRAFPMHTLASAGVRTCIGTDWVGERVPPRPISPLVSIGLAVTHAGFGTTEQIPPALAIEAYTVGSAAAEGMAAEKGTLAPGKLADLVALSDDPERVAPAEIEHLKVLLTMVGGKIVWRASGFAEPIVSRPPTIGPRVEPQPSIGPERAPSSPRKK